MSDINSVVIIGRVVEKPTLKYSANTNAVCRIRIANNDYVNKQEKVNWLTVTAFGKVAENCEKYLDKGKQICVNGKLDYQEWENKQGQKRNAVQIVAHNVQFLGETKPNQSQQPQEPVTQEPTVESVQELIPEAQVIDQPLDDTDDIPF
jgi:single-strand DNA-binding protein